MPNRETAGSAPPAASSSVSGCQASGAGPGAARGELSSEAAGRMTPSASPRTLHSLTVYAPGRPAVQVSVKVLSARQKTFLYIYPNHAGI